jgi:hypothetical protein
MFDSLLKYDLGEEVAEKDSSAGGSSMPLC